MRAVPIYSYRLFKYEMNQKYLMNMLNGGLWDAGISILSKGLTITILSEKEIISLFAELLEKLMHKLRNYLVPIISSPCLPIPADVGCCPSFAFFLQELSHCGIKTFLFLYGRLMPCSSALPQIIINGMMLFVPWEG